jgi:hypothetical protein
MINYRFDLFKKFKQFDTISMIEIESLYQELLGELVKDGWDLTSNKFEKKLVNEKKYIYDRLLASKIENGLQTNIGLNLNKKTVHKDFYENGSFVYIEIPNEIMKNQTRFLHNSDLTILNKFLKEVDWDKDWETLIYDYDEEYPKKHSTNKPLEFSWRANFSVDWFLSIRNQGFINPLIFFPGEELLSRATHRAYMLTKLGYDFPVFIPTRWITKKIDFLSNDIFLDNKRLQIKIDIIKQKVEYNFK